MRRKPALSGRFMMKPAQSASHNYSKPGIFGAEAANFILEYTAAK